MPQIEPASIPVWEDIYGDEDHGVICWDSNLGLNLIPPFWGIFLRRQVLNESW